MARSHRDLTIPAVKGMACPGRFLVYANYEDRPLAKRLENPYNWWREKRVFSFQASEDVHTNDLHDLHR